MDRARPLELDLPESALSHGTRQTYQGTRCRCALCRAANSRYEAEYRAGIRDGRPPLGAHVAATDVDRAVALLVAEGFSKTQIARAAGGKDARLRYRDTVTLRTAFRVRRLVRDWTS